MKKIIQHIKQWIKNKLSSFINKEIDMSDNMEINQDLINQVVILARDLQPLSQGAFGYFTTKTRFAISYSDPDLRKKVQEELDHAVSLLAISHVMTIFEERFPKKYWKEIINENDNFNRIMAYNHLRNCTVNGFTGKRSIDREHKYFDDIMSSQNPIEGVMSLDNENFQLAERAGYFAHSFLVELTNKIMVELYKRIV